MQKVILVDHPLVKHKLTSIRDENTNSSDFRQCLYGITLFLACEATRDLTLIEVPVKTPVEPTIGARLREEDIVIVAVLRAGLGMVPAFLDLIPGARVGHIGIFRDECSLQPVHYYAKVPSGLEQSTVVVVDPMLATGGSLVLACRMLKERGARDIRAVSLIAAPEGIKAMAEAHPEIPIYAAAVDSHLNSKGYIVPGLGDAGDRQFGTYGAAR